HSTSRNPYVGSAGSPRVWPGRFPAHTANPIRPAKSSATAARIRGEGAIGATSKSIPGPRSPVFDRVSPVAPERTAVDVVLLGASELAPPIGSRARGGSGLGAIRVVRDGAVAIAGDRIVAVGEAREITARYSAARELDADGGTIVP